MGPAEDLRHVQISSSLVCKVSSAGRHDPNRGGCRKWQPADENIPGGLLPVQGHSGHARAPALRQQNQEQVSAASHSILPNSAPPYLLGIHLQTLLPFCGNEPPTKMIFRLERCPRVIRSQGLVPSVTFNTILYYRHEFS